MVETLLIGLIKLLGSAGFGTVFGGLMGLLNRKTDIAYRKLELDHELKKRALDLQIMEREAESRIQVADIEAESRVNAAGYETMTRSYDYARPTPGGKMAAFSSFVRPFVSLAYFVISTAGAAYILHHAFAVEYIQFSQEQLYEIVSFIISWVAFMAGNTIGFWYATRAGKAPTLQR